MAAFHMSSSIAVPIHSDVIARNQKQNASVPNAPNVAVRRKSQTIGTPEAQALEHVAADAEKLSSSQFACMGKKQRMANSHSKRCKSSTMLAKQGKGMKRTSNNQNSKLNQTSIILHRAQIPPSNSTLQSAQKLTLTPHRRRLACNLKTAHTCVIGLTSIPIAKGIWEKIIVKLLGPSPHCSFIAFCVLCPNLYIQLQLQHSIIPDMFDSRLVLGLFVLPCFSISIVLFIRMFLGLTGADSVLCS